MALLSVRRRRLLRGTWGGGGRRRAARRENAGATARRHLPRLVCLCPACCPAFNTVAWYTLLASFYPFVRVFYCTSPLCALLCYFIIGSQEKYRISYANGLMKNRLKKPEPFHPLKSSGAVALVGFALCLGILWIGYVEFGYYSSLLDDKRDIC